MADILHVIYKCNCIVQCYVAHVLQIFRAFHELWNTLMPNIGGMYIKLDKLFWYGDTGSLTGVHLSWPFCTGSRFHIYDSGHWMCYYRQRTTPTSTLNYTVFSSNFKTAKIKYMLQQTLLHNVSTSIWCNELSISRLKVRVVYGRARLCLFIKSDYIIELYHWRVFTSYEHNWISTSHIERQCEIMYLRCSCLIPWS